MSSKNFTQRLQRFKDLVLAPHASSLQQNSVSGSAVGMATLHADPKHYSPEGPKFLKNPLSGLSECPSRISEQKEEQNRGHDTHFKLKENIAPQQPSKESSGGKKKLEFQLNGSAKIERKSHEHS